MPRRNSKEDADRLLAELEAAVKAKDRHQPSGRKRINRINRELMANKHMFRQRQAFFQEMQERFRQRREIDPMLMPLLGVPNPETVRVMRLCGLEPKPWQPRPPEYRTAEELKREHEELGRTLGTVTTFFRGVRERDEIRGLYLADYCFFVGLPEKKRKARAIKKLLDSRPDLRRARVYDVARELDTQSLDTL